MYYRLLSILLLFTANTGFGQVNNNVYIHLDVQDGLASNMVRSVIQDHKGYIWIGTQNGLQRYDGRKFVTYHKIFFNDNSLPSDEVKKIFEDRQGMIWIATLSGVCMLDPQTQKIIQVPIAGAQDRPIEPTAFCPDSKGTIWLALLGDGLFSYDSKQKAFVPALKDKKGFLWQPRYIQEDTLAHWYWLACDSGLAIYNRSKDEVYTHDNNPLNLPVLRRPEFYHNALNPLLKAGNRLWVLLWDFNAHKYGHYVFNTASQTIDTYQPTYEGAQFFWVDSRGNPWLYGDLFNYYDPQDGTFHEVARSKEKNGIDYNITYQPLEDREHNIWVGTDKGVYIFSTNNQKVYTKQIVLPPGKEFTYGEILGFQLLQNGEMWVPTWGFGTFVFDNKMKQVAQLDFAKQTKDGNYNLEWCILRSTNGKVWIGCQAGRLITYDPSVKQYAFLKPQAFNSSTIRTMVQDIYGDTWLGTHGGRVVKWNHVSNQFIPVEIDSSVNDEMHGVISKLVADREGSIWVMTSNDGLVQINAKTGNVQAHYRPVKNDRNSLSSMTVSCGVDNDSTLVLGTMMGVNIFNKKTKTFRHITTADGLPGNTIYSIDKDSKGNIWVKLIDWLAKITPGKHEITLYSFKEGRIPEGGSTTITGMYNDQMFISNKGGFTYFHIDSLAKKAIPPDVQITGMYVLGKEINIDSLLATDMPLSLRHSQNSVSIQFSSLSYFNNNLTYYYQLEGIDEDIVKADASLTTNYTNLPGGNYVFKVWSVNGDGVRSRHILSLPIYVKPIFWRSWWFIMIALVLIGGTSYGIYYIRLRRLLAMEKVRESIARDLHDDMGSTLSTINILSEMAKMKIKNDPQKTEEYIGKISDNSQRMMESMDDIVWSINPLNDSMQKTVARMREYAANTLEARDIEYQMAVDNSIYAVKLNMQMRRDLFLIYKEGINNLAKYSACTTAYINVGLDNPYLVMKIRDNGTGFDIAGADGGNGLGNMKKRAISSGGRLTITSELHKGTTLLLELPVT